MNPQRLSTVFAVLMFVAGMSTAQPIPPPQAGVVQVDWRANISQHDLVYLSPPEEGWEGLPIGDGEAGAILWNPAGKLILQINHSSLWDDVPVGAPNAKELAESAQEGRRGVNRHAARLEIDPGLPIYDWKYLSDYEARLNVYDAEIELESNGSLGSASLRALYSHPRHVLLLEYSDRLNAPTSRKILIERLGSRTFGNWRGTLVQDPAIGLARTGSGQEENDLWISKKLGSLEFAVAMRVEPKTGVFTINAQNDFQCVAEAKQTEQTAFTLFLAVAHSEEADDPVALARKRVREAAEAGAERVRAEHREDWAAQWNRAFIDLPEDRYWENLWRLIDYTNISSRRGKDPPFFINSIWAWERDVQAWAGSYYTWNMWSPNFPLFATGRVELLKPYFEWKNRQLPHAIAFARQQHGLEGAFFTDYASRLGEQPVPAKYWPISGPLIAQEFYKYYEYTQDVDFLKREALPFLRETARFLVNYSEEGEDGKLHLRPTIPYEFHGPYQFKDCITEQAMVRWLLPALIQAEKVTGSVSELSARAADFLSRLAPIRSGPIDEHWLLTEAGRKVYANPFFRGEPYSEKDQVFSTGWSTKHKRYVTHMDISLDPSSRYGVLCGAQVSPVWLAGLVGPDQSPERRDITGKNSAEDISMWERGRNGLRTMRLFPTRQPDPNQTRTHGDKYVSWTGHNQDLPAFARLGLRKNLRTAMETYVQKYQITSQGFWNYWPWERWKDGVGFPQLGDTGKRVPFPEDPRILHSSLEPTGIFPVTLQESLMTSYDGVIRLFPAYDRNAGFRLAAKGGFWITSRRMGGEVEFVQIESNAGKECVISNPWPGQEPALKRHGDGTAVPFERQRDRIRFATTKGGLYLLTRKGKQVAPWQLGGVRRVEPHLYRVKVHTEPQYPIEAPGGIMTKVLGKERSF